MATFVYRDGELVEKDKAGPRIQGIQAGYVISDEMDATRHMADGKYYTSKAKFRQATRAAGCIEVGNEAAAVTKQRQPIPLDPVRRREDIQRAIYDLKNRGR